MLALYLGGIAILLGVLLAARWFVNAQPRTLVHSLRLAGIGMSAVAAGYLALTGRLGWILMVLPVLVPLAIQMTRGARTARVYARMSGAGSGGQASRVETRFLSMTLDIDSGGLDGEVREGSHAGQQLSELTVKELIALLRTYQAQDRQSAQVLRAYLDRTHPGWRVDEAAEWSKDDAAGEATDSSTGEMTRDQALRILGLQQGASEAEIRAAYQRLIAVLHPDRGGSSFLAAQVNRARDILTKG